MQERGFVESFNAAVEGFIHVLKNERNMRIHFMVAALIVLLGIFLNFTYLEILSLAIVIALVLMAEMFNTAIELTMDMIRKERDPVVRLIKDISAGAVLLTAINAAISGYILFAKKIPFNIKAQTELARQSPWHISLIALILVFTASIMGKLFFHKGKPLRGGMPSGHAAIAFAIWTIIVFMTNNSIVIGLTFAMAFMIARHRVRDSIHTLWEVLAGSVLGIILTVLVFQIFR